MADPTRYLPGYSYSGFEASSPSDPKPGSQLDNDFANLQEATDSLVDAVKDIRRSDGALKNGVVTVDSLSAGLVMGFTVEGEWTDGFEYGAADGVSYGTSFYKARVAHTASPSTRPDLDDETWAFLFTFSTIGVSDGSVTAVKLNAPDAPAIRGVVGQEELVAEAVANVGAETTPQDVDLFPMIDTSGGGVLLKLTWANLKAGVLAALEPSIWTSLGGLIAGGTSKVTPVDADTIPLSDSAATNATKKLTWANLKTALASALLPLTGGTLTGNLSIDKTQAVFNLMSAAANEATIQFYEGAVRRWKFYKSTSAALAIKRYDAAGAELGTAMTIANATGIVTFEASPVVPTPSAGDDSTKVATTAFVQSEAGWTIGTPVTVSAASTDFTGIPAGVTKITVSGASLLDNANGVVSLQLGDSGGIETTGYVGSKVELTTAANVITNLGASFSTQPNVNANAVSVVWELTLINAATNLWSCLCIAANEGATSPTGSVTVGNKALTGVLDRVRVTFSSGTPSSGSLNIAYQ